jgi:hypothetical protein
MAWRTTWIPGATLALLGMTLLLVIAVPRADAAYLYWSNDSGEPGHPGTIGRANIDGTGADNALFTSPEGACGVAADSNYVYWASGGGPIGHVARGNPLTGAIENAFISTTNTLNCGVAVNASSVFFNNFAIGAIGRANLDGTGADQDFITGGDNSQHPAVNATHVFWVNKDGQSIGRAELGGGDVQQSLVMANCPEPVGVAANSEYVYWANTGCESIGRAKLTPSGVTDIEQEFVDLDEEGPCGLAVDGNYIYWGRYSEETGGYVGRADLATGKNVNEKFIPTSGYTCGVAVGPSPAPAPPAAAAKAGFRLIPPVKCTKGCKKIQVKFQFEAAGQVIAEQAVPKPKSKTKKQKKRAAASAKKKKTPKLIKKLSKSVSAGIVTLSLKPTGAGKKALKKKGKLKVKVRFTFTPTGGQASTLEKSITAKPPKTKKKPKR